MTADDEIDYSNAWSVADLVALGVGEVALVGDSGVEAAPFMYLSVDAVPADTDGQVDLATAAPVRLTLMFTLDDAATLAATIAANTGAAP